MGGEGWVGWEGNMCFFCYKDLIFQLDASDLSSSSTCQNIKESELHLNPILYVLHKLIQHFLKVKFHNFFVFKPQGNVIQKITYWKSCLIPIIMIQKPLKGH